MLIFKHWNDINNHETQEPVYKETKLHTFTRSSNGTTKGSSVRMASCLSSDTDSGGGSKPTATHGETVVSGAHPPCQAHEATTHYGSTYRYAAKSKAIGAKNQPLVARSWGWRKGPLHWEWGNFWSAKYSIWLIMAVYVYQKSQDSTQQREFHSKPALKEKVLQNSPSRVDCRGPILPIRRNRHACLEAGT